MEMINIPKEEYERMKMQLVKLKNLEKIDSDLSLLSENSFAETWLNEKEDEAWRNL